MNFANDPGYSMAPLRRRSEDEIMQEALRKANNELERRVKERTSELALANQELKREIKVRKQTEEKLRESEERYRNVYSTAPLAFVIWDRDCLITDWNKRAEKMFGWSKQEVINRNFFEFLIPDEARPKVADIVESLLHEKLPNTSINRNLTKSGKIILCEWNNSIQYNSDGRILGVISLALDITERKRAEESLRESEEKFRLAFENATDAIFWANPETGLIINCNKAAESLLEKRREEIVGQDQTTLHPPEKAQYYAKSFRMRLEEKATDSEEEIITRTGKIIPVRITSATTLIGKRPIVQGIYRDITTRKQAEEKLKSSSEKLKLVAYSVGHDLKSPAIAISGLTKRFHTLYGKTLDEKARVYSNQILKSSEQITALVQNINEYISTKETPLNIDIVKVKEILSILRDEFSIQLKARQVQLIEPMFLPEIKVDKLSLVRVFRNLVDNALKYGGSELSKIEIGYVETAQSHIFSVQDDGSGLKQDQSTCIFGLFRREKTSTGVEGTGLGLAIVKEIVEQHHGAVWTDLTIKKGIIFNFSISRHL